MQPGNNLSLSPSVPGLDLIPFVATMVACLLLGLDYGIVLGIVVNLAFILYATARPHTAIRTVVVHGSSQRGPYAHIKRRAADNDDDDDAAVDDDGDGHNGDDDAAENDNVAANDGHNVRHDDDDVDDVCLLVVQPDQSLVFSAAEHLRAKVLRHVRRHRLEQLEQAAAVAEKPPAEVVVDPSTTVVDGPQQQQQQPTSGAGSAVVRGRQRSVVVVLDGRHVRTVDVTVVRNLEQLRRDLCEQHRDNADADDADDADDGTALVFWRWPAQPEAVAWRQSPALGACFWPAERTLRAVAARVQRGWREAQRTEERLRWQQA